MNGVSTTQWVLGFLFAVLICGRASAQFSDEFNDPSLEGWTFSTGDGAATMDFRQRDGYATIFVDATQDQHNIWWALIKRPVAAALDLGRLREPGYELRVEARIRVSHAPRRVNLHLNTQKTVDFHTHLMEFDIPDTLRSHTISMTTRDFQAEPGDAVNAQLALMDWGLEKYRVDLDYFKVDVVNVASTGPDKGEQVPYHPPIPDQDTFVHHVGVVQDGMISLQYPDVNFNDWDVTDETGKTRVLMVSGTQFVILRWDLSAFAGTQIAGHGLLELTTHSVQVGDAEVEEFGQVRVAEILGGDPAWNQETVTLNSLTRGRPLDEVFNSQMIIDVRISEGRGRKILITISRPVLQRMVAGGTLGLVLRPLGAINATFYALEQERGAFSARLHFNTSDTELKR